ncbi:MAG: T9SS type A sorting domain-containing protein [Bacteroidota bacterium]
MKSKFQIILLVLAMLLTTMAFGQRRMNRAGNGLKFIEESKAELQLTSEQEQQLEELKAQFEADRKALKETDFEDRQAQMDARKAMMEEHREAIESLLTPEQQSILKAKAAARKQNRKEAWKEVDKKGLKADLKAYREKNIEPVIRAQRAKLEPAIAAEDKATINELRQAYKAHHEEMKALKKEQKASQTRDRAAFKALREEMKEEDQTMKALVDKYEEEIDGLMEEIAPQAEQWRADMQAIQEQYVPEDLRQAKGEKGRRGKGKKKARGKGKKGAQKMGPLPKKGRFLLMDPNATGEEAALFDEVLKEPVENFVVYPNPAKSRATASFDIAEASTFQVELRSEQGEVVQVLESQRYREVGTYQLPIDLGNLKDGVYYVVLSGEMGVKAQKIVVARN